MSIGVVTLTSSAAIAVGQLLKFGADAAHVDVCGAADTPVGFALQAASGAGVDINVQLLGTARPVPLVGIASAAITHGAYLEPAASGRVQTLGGGVGTHHVVGMCLNDPGGAAASVTISPANFLRVI